MFCPCQRSAQRQPDVLHFQAIFSQPVLEERLERLGLPRAFRQITKQLVKICNRVFVKKPGGILLDLARFGGGQVRVQTSDSCDEVVGRDLATQVCRATS